MNESLHHPKLHVCVTLGAKVFVAGEDVYGKIELACDSESVGIRTICVVFTGVQQLTSRYHAATSTFLETLRIFQGPGLPPSNAVVPHSTNAEIDLPPDYHPARKGQTTFFFRLPLPASSPSSITFGNGLARVAYQAKAGVEVFWKGDRRLVVDPREIDVVEALDEEAPGADLGRVVVGDGGRIWTHARIIGGMGISGSSACCQLHVKNNSARKISGVTVNLSRKLHLEHPPADSTGIEISDSLLSIPFRGPDYTVQAFSEGVANLVFTVPRNMRGVRSGLRENAEGDRKVVKESLFDIQCTLIVRLGMGFATPDLEIVVPMRIYHPSAIPPSLQHLTSPVPAEVWDQAYDPPVAPTPPFAQERAFSMPPSPQFVPHPSHRIHDEQAISPTSVYSLPPPAPYSPVPVDHVPSTALSQYPWAPPPHILSPFLPSEPHNLYGQSSVAPQISAESPAHYLIRPSSADPYTSQPPIHHIPRLLPAQFAPPAVLHVPPPADQVRRGWDGDEEPGNRASRISKHLQLSSRHRSVSPPRSRYAIGSLSPASLNVDTSMTHPDTSGSHIWNNMSNEQPPVSISPLQSPILSPRPILSPTHSFSNDNIGSLSSAGGRSPRVEELERLVSEHDSETGNDLMPAPSDSQTSEPQYPPLISGIDKTLPHCPTTSNKFTARVRGLPAAMDIFSEADPVGKTVTLLPKSTTSLKTRSTPPENVGGLTLLERRLLSRAVVMPEATQGNGSRPSNDDRPRQEDKDKTLTKAEASSMSQNVRDHNSLSRLLVSTIRLPVAEINSESRRSAIREMRSEANVRVTEWLTREKDGKQSLEHDFNSRRTNLGHIPTRNQTGPGSISKVKEPSSTRSHSGSSLPPYEAEPPVERTDEPPASPMNPPGVKASPTVAVSKERTLATAEPGVLTQNHLASRPDLDAFPRSPKPVKPRFKLPAYPPPPPPTSEDVKYDVRSARGGRGGVVASVASFWGNISGDTKETKPPGQGPPARRVDTPQIVNTGFRKSVLPLDIIRQAAGVTQGSPSRPGAKDRQRRPPPVLLKQPPLAAGVVNGTVGRPVLSSAATLARPVPRKIAPEASSLLSTPQPREQRPALKPRSEDPPAVGQERLRELIARYQN